MQSSSSFRRCQLGSQLTDELKCWIDTWEDRETDRKAIPDVAQSTLATADQWGGFLTFPNVCTLLLLVYVFPVTTCTCERSVSALRRIKTFLRTSCGQERLNGLTLLNMYRDVKISSRPFRKTPT